MSTTETDSLVERAELKRAAAQADALQSRLINFNSGIVVSITRVKPTSTMASSRIALFLGKQLKVPVLSTRAELVAALLQAKRNIPYLIIVNGPVVFCNFDDLLEEMIGRTRNLIYVQNDYAIEVLKRTANPVQKNRMRAAMNAYKGELSYWTTVEPTLKRAPEKSTLVNWNALTWRPPTLFPGIPRHVRKCLYYGAFRKARLPSFDKYFGVDSNNDYFVSATKTAAKNFTERYPGLDVQPHVEDVINAFGGRFAAGLLLADRLSNKVYHSPPNRWYEMLSMDLPVLVDKPCEPTLARAGYPAKQVVVDGNEVFAALRSRKFLSAVYESQAEYRRYDPRPRLRRELREACARSAVPAP